MYQSVIGQLLDADYRPTDNRPLSYWCISNWNHPWHCPASSSNPPASHDKRQIKLWCGN